MLKDTPYRSWYRSGRASAHGTGGPGFDSRGRVIQKTLQMLVMVCLFGAQELRVSNTVLVLIKLTKFAVALRLRCGSCKLIF